MNVSGHQDLQELSVELRMGFICSQGVLIPHTLSLLGACGLGEVCLEGGFRTELSSVVTSGFMPAVQHLMKGGQGLALPV